MTPFPALRLPFLVLCLGLVGPVDGLRADPDPLAPGEKAASDWIQVRIETANLETAWSSERPILESTIGGLKERADSLEDKRDHLKSKTSKDREDLAVMQEKSRAAGDDLKAADEHLRAVAERMIEMRSSLPPRLSEALEMSYRSLAKKDLSAGERMQLLMTMLARCAQFNRNVTSGEEVIAFGNEGPKSVEVIYWGLSHGYALDRSAGMAWFGSPGAQGWAWEAHSESVAGVERLIAVYNDKADPEIVDVPARLAHPQAGIPLK